VSSDIVPSWLTAEWLSAVLERRVGALRARRIGDGLVGMNLRVELLGSEAGPTSVVVKLPAPEETSRATGVGLRNYEREVRFYGELAQTVDIRIAKCHLAEWDPADGSFVLVLEDLAPGVQGNQLSGCSVAQARTAVAELARLHGPRWDDPTLAPIEWLSRRSSADGVARLVELWERFVPAFLATYARHLSTDELDLIDRFGPRLADYLTGREPPFTLVHGDYRLDNLLFESPAGGYPVAAVDWQTPGHAPALSDVSYFLGAGLLPDDRRANERSIVDDYVEALDAYGIDVDTGWVWRQYRREAFAGLVMAVTASQVVTPSTRSEALFTVMATRHARHAIDLAALDVL
jgi:hypothetical protein